MNIPKGYADLADATNRDRLALTDLEQQIAHREQILAEGPEALERMKAARAELATSVEVSEGMLMHARRTYGLPAPGAVPLPTEAVALEHYRDDPTVTAAHPLEPAQDGDHR